MVAAWLLWTDRADQVWLLPTFSHPFSKELLQFDERVRMCRALAAAIHPAVQVCTIERELPVPSYTVDTLDQLSTRHPEHHFRLVIGADVLAQTGAWKSWDRIETSYPPHVVGRLGYPKVPGAVSFPEVSSTEIRRRRAAREPYSHLVPASVAVLYDALPHRSAH